MHSRASGISSRMMARRATSETRASSGVTFSRYSSTVDTRPESMKGRLPNDRTCPTTPRGARQGTLVLICGLPGAGKTTFAKRLASERQALRMCPDDWIEQILAHPEDTTERDRLRDPVENLQWDLTLEYLTLGLTVILENGFWAEEERSLYAIGALEVGASIEFYFLEAPYELLWERIEKRNQELGAGPWVMSREDLDSAWSIFQPPASEEMEFYDNAAVITAG